MYSFTLTFTWAAVFAFSRLFFFCFLFCSHSLFLSSLLVVSCGLLPSYELSRTHMCPSPLSMSSRKIASVTSNSSLTRKAKTFTIASHFLFSFFSLCTSSGLFISAPGERESETGHNYQKLWCTFTFTIFLSQARASRGRAQHLSP